MRIEEGWLTEPVVFFIGHYIPFKTMSFLFNSVLYFPHNYHIVKDEKENRCYLKTINYNKVNSNFLYSVSKVCASLICSMGICSGGICPRG